MARLLEFLRLPEFVGLVFREGMVWSVAIAFDKLKHIQAAGDNVYPSFSKTTTSSISMDRFGLLIDFVDRMLYSPDGRIQTLYSKET